MAEYPADQIFAPAETIKCIASNNNTPFYLYDRQGIQNSVNKLHCLFSWSEHFQNYFPIRENNNPHLLRLLHDLGTGVCANSKSELQLAMRCGFHGDTLLYEPLVKDQETEKLAHDCGAGWFCNSASLLPDILPKKLILRYNPCDLNFPPQIKQAVLRSKCGFNREDLFETAQLLVGKGLDEIGLAMQISNYSLHKGFWAKKTSILLTVAEQLTQQTGLSVRYCHIGEGPGLPYHPSIKAPDYKEEADEVRKVLEKLPETARPILYTAVTGRLLEENGILITKVLEIRQILKTYLVLDSGVCQYIRPILKQAYRHLSVLGNSQMEKRKTYYVVGTMPVSFDRFSLKGRILPVVKPGDYCVVHDTGCGARCMPMLYGSSCIPGEYLYCEDGSIQQIAPHRTEEEVLDFLTAL